MKQALFTTLKLTLAILLVAATMLGVSNVIGLISDTLFINTLVKSATIIGILACGSIGLVFLSHLPQLETGRQSEDHPHRGS